MDLITVLNPITKYWARGSEAQRAEAAVRHQGRSTFWGFIHPQKKKSGRLTGGLSDFLPNTGGLSDVLLHTGGLSDPPLKIRGFIEDKPKINRR